MKGSCPHCRGVIDLSESEEARPIQCPSCEQIVDIWADVERRTPLTRLKKRIWLAAGGIVALVLTVLAFRYRGRFFSGLDLIAEGTGGRTSAAWALAGVLLVLFFAVVWLVFPFVVFHYLRDIRRRTAELDETTRLCVRHLAQLSKTQERPPALSNAPPKPPAPGSVKL